MINLLKFEWRKLWRSKSLYIVFSVGFISIILFMMLSKILLEVLNTPPNATQSMLPALENSNYVSLLGIYISLFVCGDFSQHTIKNIYARGYNRSVVYFSKYLISLFVAIMVALFYMGFGFLFALIQGGEVGSMPVEMWGKLAQQLWVVVGLHGLFFGISMMFNKIAGSLALNLVGISIVFVLLNLIFQIAKIDFDITQYNLELILTGLSGNISSTFTPQPSLVRAIVMPICYVIVFVGGGWLVNQRRDV